MAVKVVDFINYDDGDVIMRLVGQTDVEIQKLAETIVRREYDGAEEYLTDTTDWLHELEDVVANYVFAFEFHQGTFGVGHSFYSYDKLADYR